MRLRINYFIFFLCIFFTTKASEITSVDVLTDQIIVVRFSDGHIDYHGYHQIGAEDITVKNELNTKAASSISKYLISGRDDSNYKGGKHPVKTGRKSKGSGFSMKCMPNDKNLCMSDYVLEHFIYLFLPEPLKSGKKYILNTFDLASDKNQIEFQYNNIQSRSLAIHVNQLGFIPDAPEKYAYISHWLGDAGPLELDELAPLKFHILRVSDLQKVFSGNISKQKDFETGGPDGPEEQGPNGNFVAADVWQCDFSEFSIPGEYVVSVDRIGISFPFRIDSDIYREPFVQTCRSLYHHRSGIELKQPFTKYERKAPHNPNITPNFKLIYSKFRYMDTQNENAKLADLEALFDESVDCSNMWGWYQDAGDWDAYISHAVIPAFLLTTFELKPKNFTDGELNIPESGNGIPDILDEAGWLLNLYRRAKGPTGGNAGARIEGDSYPNKEAGHGLPSYEDVRPHWIVYAEEPRLTYIYAKLAAQTAYCYRVAENNQLLSEAINTNDSVSMWYNEAINAFRWAENNLRDGDGPKVISYRADAQAWLYKLKGEKKWLEGFKANLTVNENFITNFHTYQWGIWAYVTTPAETIDYDTELKKVLDKATENFARQSVTDAIESNRSFRMGGPKNMKCHVGQATTPMVLPAIMAWEVTKNKKYLSAVYSTCDYMLGGNQLDMTWITGVGDQHPTQVFNMDWWYNEKGIKDIVPGIVPYGPTADCDWMQGKNGDCNAWGWWDSDYAHSVCYPDKSVWPVHERWYNNRYAPPSSEYTVHQNIGPAAAIYGYLANEIKK